METICDPVHYLHYILCMKYTESPVANITQGEAKCYICHKTHQELYISYQRSNSALSVYCILHLLTVNKIHFFEI